MAGCLVAGVEAEGAQTDEVDRGDKDGARLLQKSVGGVEVGPRGPGGLETDSPVCRSR